MRTTFVRGKHFARKDVGQVWKMLMFIFAVGVLKKNRKNVIKYLCRFFCFFVLQAKKKAQLCTKNNIFSRLIDFPLLVFQFLQVINLWFVLIDFYLHNYLLPSF